jgi:hypothetical protein
MTKTSLLLGTFTILALLVVAGFVFLPKEEPIPQVQEPLSSSSQVHPQRTPAPDPNPTVLNPENDLWGLNYGDFISLWWAPQEGASEYILSRSFSSEGPWEEDVRTSDSKAVDFTPDARVTDLCYRVEALDANSVVIRSYDPVCIPKFVEKQNRDL